MRLLKHLNHQLYGKRERLEGDIVSIIDGVNDSTSREHLKRSYFSTRNHIFSSLLTTKNRKFDSLLRSSQPNSYEQQNIPLSHDRTTSTHLQLTFPLPANTIDDDNSITVDDHSAVSQPNRIYSTTVASVTTSSSSQANPSTVVNLSDYRLTNAEYNVLSLGLNFSPSRRMDLVQTCGDLESFIRRMRLREMYGTASPTTEPVDTASTVPKPKKKVFFTPEEGRNVKLDLYLSTLRQRVKSECLSRHRKVSYNLTPTQLRAIRSLKDNQDIIIKPDDKGGATVILNRQDYISEAFRQLEQPNYYSTLNTDPTQQYRKELLQLIRTFDPDLQRYFLSLIPANPSPGIFYTIPKIHKEGVPGRPIISGIGTLCENISGFVETILKPIVRTLPSFLLDTKQFLRKLSEHDDIPPDTILVTLDVTSLYTNIPHEDGLVALRSHLNDQNCPSVDAIVALVRFILSHNYFLFQDQFFLQKSGTAMGTRMAPQYANLFMGRLEQEFLDSCELKPSLYLRYIDDIFMLWPHGLDALQDFFLRFNAFHPTIKFKMDYSSESVNFLDTKVIFRNGHISTSLYRKPTDSLSFLHYSSFHPTHTKNSIPYSQALRYHRNCSDPHDRDRHLSDLRNRFISLGFDGNYVDSQFRKATQRDRHSLIHNDSPPQEQERVPFVLTYQPHFQHINRILRQLQPMLDNDPYLSPLFPLPPIISYRQPPKLRNLLVHSKLPSVDDISSVGPCNVGGCLLALFSRDQFRLASCA